MINNKSYVTAFTYDLADNLISITHPSGRVVTYVRDALGRVTSVTTAASGVTTAIASNIAYEPFGPVSSMQLGNGLDVALAYDTDGRLTGIDTGNATLDIQDLALGHDAASRITSLADALDASRSQTFAYDALSRLTDATGAYGDIDYAWDAGSNRTSRIIDDGLSTRVEASTVAAGSNRFLSVTDGTFTRTLGHDAAGNITSDTRLDGTQFAYGYDHAGRLSSITRDGSTDVTYLHDLTGLRVAKFSTVPGLPGAHYIHGPGGELIAEANTAGTVTSETIWLGDMPLALITDADTAAPRVHWIHSDHLGTPQKLTDDTGTVVWDAVTTPFGELASLTGNLTQNFRLPGQYADIETGLYQNWWRDYDPALGRYVQADPIGLAGGANLYGYANANPLSFVDREGLTSMEYDLENGTLTVDPENSTDSPYQVPATSGKGSCMGNASCASYSNTGPIPPGNYQLNANDLSNPSFLGDLMRNILGDWGDWRIKINPLLGTDPFGRSGFFLHGGSLLGSAGCIDIGGGILGNDITNRVLNDIQSDPDRVVPFVVKSNDY